LNGFNQEVAGLTHVAGTASNARAVSNTSTTLSTFTVNNTANFSYGPVGAITGGLITGNVALVKNGAGTLTLSSANTFTGNVTVNGGTLVAAGATVTGLGSATTAGRVVTVNSGGALSFTTNNVFGNGQNNPNLPSLVLNGSSLNTTRYNVLGDVTLNGGTLVNNNVTDAGSYEGFQLRGNVTVGGTAPSTISSTGTAKAVHLNANTTFNVADVTGSAAGDLIVSAVLRNQSGDFALAAGGLTKSGVGTLELSATNTYTGATVINAGTLLVTGSISGSATTVNAGGTLSGNGTVGSVNVVGGTVAPGTSPGTLSAGPFSLDSNSLIKFELAQAGVSGGGINDLINVTGPLTLDGTLQVLELSAFSNGSYPLFTYTGGLTNNVLNLQPAFVAAHPGSFIDVTPANQVNLVVVPEPVATVSLLIGAGSLLAVRRRRRSGS
jgi:fibronectin-binding autotransporter adhesin